MLAGPMIVGVADFGANDLVLDGDGRQLAGPDTEKGAFRRGLPADIQLEAAFLGPVCGEYPNPRRKQELLP